MKDQRPAHTRDLAVGRHFHAALAEAALLGQPWNEKSLAAAQAALAADFTPLSDMRASADYRRQVARGLLKRLWLETRRSSPLAQASVWARADAASA